MTQYYDPQRLVREVQALLRTYGLDPESVAGEPGLAEAGAGMLLRGLGITPALDGVDALARAMDKPWTEADAR
ncbi:hypothetical protein [Planobispora longispora]|uniref:Uncharacterized protein n=1 Tax=Planobispora longispora TaxID=28887 RepID=A0A8J3RKJ9_9ACTN|nr:hypothetical protein [Planobispora longispora]GIH78221.1 hypothetical protein Plo01_46500 [Planobispora longispora]